MKGSTILPVLIAGLTPFLVLTVIIVWSGLGLVAWRPPVLWSDQLGITPYGNRITEVAADSMNVYVAGYLGYVDGGTQGTLFVRRYDSGGGGVVWNRTIGSAPDRIGGISAVPDGVYALGSISNNITLLKYDLNGNKEWTRGFGGPTGEGETVSATTGGAYVAGTVTSPLTSQSFMGRIMFVREYDSVGDVVWTSEFSNSSGYIIGIRANSSGVYVLTDRLLVKYDLKGNRLWMRSVGGTGLASDMTGEYVSGYSTLPYGFLRKYDSDGNVAWSVQFDAPDHSGVGYSSVSADSSGVYLSMNSIAVHVFVMKYDSGGGQIWSFQMPTAGLVFTRVAYSVAVGTNGFYIGGSLRTLEAGYAFVEEFGQSSSLIFFGFNPPVSFGIVGVLAGVVAVSIVFFRRHRNKLPQRPPSIYRPPVSFRTKACRASPEVS